MQPFVHLAAVIILLIPVVLTAPIPPAAQFDIRVLSGPIHKLMAAHAIPHTTPWTYTGSFTSNSHATATFPSRPKASTHAAASKPVSSDGMNRKAVYRTATMFRRAIRDGRTGDLQTEYARFRSFVDRLVARYTHSHDVAMDYGLSQINQAPHQAQRTVQAWMTTFRTDMVGDSDRSRLLYDVDRLQDRILFLLDDLKVMENFIRETQKMLASIEKSERKSAKKGAASSTKVGKQISPVKSKTAPKSPVAPTPVTASASTPRSAKNGSPTFPPGASHELSRPH